MLREGNINESDVEALHLTDSFEDVRGILDARRAPAPAALAAESRLERHPVAVAATKDEAFAAVDRKTAWSSSVPGLSITSTSVSSSGSCPRRSVAIRRAAASRCSRSQPRSSAAAAARSRSTCASRRSNAGRERLSWRWRAK